MNTSDWHVSRRRALGHEIARLRRDHHLSQEELAYRANLDRSYMGRIERGEQSVSFDKILDICNALSIGPSQLFAAIESDSKL